MLKKLFQCDTDPIRLTLTLFPYSIKMPKLLIFVWMHTCTRVSRQPDRPRDRDRGRKLQPTSQNLLPSETKVKSVFRAIATNNCVLKFCFLT